ncbi:hypothetical protein [Kribbella solani]|uniref:hypothetical protein n=1 Tax=Kribbella solani TaxID=236067 RepID=UPI0029A57DF3|nr:hypothetical protein [Kribbella solani]MDX2968864.1 hypothetical protein [Kribbella solani]
MADATVSALVQRINELVVADTGTRSLAVGEQIAGRVTRTNERYLRPLADNLHHPDRLRPPLGQVDVRPALREALTETVAACAGVLVARERPLGEIYDLGRDRFEAGISRAYAESAMPRLMAQLLPEGQAAYLGKFEPRQHEGDVLAARAVVVSIIARTEGSEREVLRDLVAAGRGAVAPAAARMLLEPRDQYQALPARHRDALVEDLAYKIESHFERAERQRPGTDVMANFRARRAAANLGADAITAASKLGNEAMSDLYRGFDEFGWPEEPRPKSVDALCRQVQDVVGELSEAPGSRWNGRIQIELGQAPDATLRLSATQIMALSALMESSSEHPLTTEQAATAREALQVVAASYARMAVPDDYSSTLEAAAVEFAPRYTVIDQAVGQAFAEDNYAKIVDLSLPSEQARQVREAPAADQRLAPAARGFASAIDVAARRQDGETLRLMTGQDRIRMSETVADALVTGPLVEPWLEPTERLRVADEIAEKIDERFDALPGELDRWAGGEQTFVHDQSVADPFLYGHQTGRLANQIVETHVEARAAEAAARAEQEAAALAEQIAEEERAIEQRLLAEAHDAATEGLVPPDQLEDEAWFLATEQAAHTPQPPPAEQVVPAEQSGGAEQPVGPVEQADQTEQVGSAGERAGSGVPGVGGELTRFVPGHDPALRPPGSAAGGSGTGTEDSRAAPGKGSPNKPGQIHDR